jgi:hypothetical protein
MNWRSYLPLIVGAVLSALGIPIFTEVYKITQNFWVSIATTILYELVVIIGGFVGNVWQRLGGIWADRLAGWIDLTLQSIFSDYRKKYLEYIVYQHRVFDVKGLSTQGPFNLELEKVYVELGVDPTSAHIVNSNPITMLPEVLRSGSHTIWEYVADKNVQSNNYAILGAPGSGKTTLLKHMALALASPKHKKQNAGAPNLLPILLFLRDHQKPIAENPKILLAQLIRDQFADRQAPVPPAGWLEKQLEQGKCLIMLDGLDEVADISTRKSVVNWVDQCMASYGKNRFVLSSRPFGY